MLYAAFLFGTFYRKLYYGFKVIDAAFIVPYLFEMLMHLFVFVHLLSVILSWVAYSVEQKFGLCVVAYFT